MYSIQDKVNEWNAKVDFFKDRPRTKVAPKFMLYESLQNEDQLEVQNEDQLEVQNEVQNEAHEVQNEVTEVTEVQNEIQKQDKNEVQNEIHEQKKTKERRKRWSFFLCNNIKPLFEEPQ